MTRRSTPGRLAEAAARDVLLLQAFESIEPPSPSWHPDDAAWATRAAREASPESDSAEAFLATRAHLALRRLLPREPVLAAAWPPAAGSGRRLGLAAVGIGFIVGLVADAIGSSQHINLLAPPVWTVVAWNLAVYLLLIAAAARAAFATAPGRPGLGARLAERLARFGRAGPASAAVGPGSTAAALRAFAARWSALVAPLAVSRATVLLHTAAAALGLGLVAGLYARGLVLDYRVAWESTFLSAADVHAVLSTLFAPASWLSGIALPTPAAVAALRAAHGDAAVGAPAAPWIHLYAWTLAIAVVVPRASLAAVGALRVRRAAARLRLPLDDPYFRRIALQRRGEIVQAQLCPYAQTPTASAIAGVRALLVEALGDGLTLATAPTTRFGDEDDDEAKGAPAPADATLAVALFDLGATPEPEHHGRFLSTLAARTATIACVDEAAFKRRFGADGRRIVERRAAWSQLLAVHGSVPVFGDFDAMAAAVASNASPPATGAALRAALASPVHARR